MDRNDIKIVSLEAYDKSIAIKLAKEIERQMYDRYGERNVTVITHDFEVDPGMIIGNGYGKFMSLYKELKEELDTTLLRIKRRGEMYDKGKEIHILLPNLFSVISCNMSNNLNRNCKGIIPYDDVKHLRHQGLLGFSDDNSQILDVFDYCNYSNYDFDLLIRCIGESCLGNEFSLAIPKDKHKLGDYVSKYLLRRECVDTHFNGVDYILKVNPASVKSLTLAVDRIIKAINLYGIE